MDLLSEASSGTRVLTARHISADKNLPSENNAINTTLLCHNFSLAPDFGIYTTALQSYAWVLWACGLLVLLAICALYAVTMRAVIRHRRESVSYAAIVLAVYPLVSGASFIVLLVPRARIISEALAQQAVMVAMYQFYCMIVAEAGGADKFVRRAGGSHLDTRVLPCCCWPCCIIPRPKLEIKSFRLLRCLILQMPVIQALLYVIMLVLWAEDMKLYAQSFIYIQPFVAASILTGVWGTIMCVRAAEGAGMPVRRHFFAVQLVLIIVKLQCGFAKILPEIVSIPCILALHPTVFVHMLQYALTMLEMLLLSAWAWGLYSVPPGKVGKVQQIVVAVVDDLCADKIKDGGDKTINNNVELK